MYQSQPAEPVVSSYCVKCKARRVLESTSTMTMKSGTPVIQGQCGVCESILFKIGSHNEKET